MVLTYGLLLLLTILYRALVASVRAERNLGFSC